VAARHDVYPSLLHTWRRQVRDGHLVAAQALQFVPVRLTDPPSPASTTAPPVNNHPAGDTIASRHNKFARRRSSWLHREAAGL
jgi:transposase-like protein